MLFVFCIGPMNLSPRGESDQCASSRLEKSCRALRRSAIAALYRQIGSKVYGGAEANVAVSLARFGEESAFVTKLPEHGLGQAAIDSLRRYEAETSHIVRGGKRIGIYFQERGAAQRPAQILYDRKNSAFALSDPNEYDWKKILKGANWLHCSGITPALGENAQKIAEFAFREAKQQGLIYSLLHCHDLQSAIGFAVAAECLKHRGGGDFNLISPQEVIAPAHGDGPGTLSR